MLRPTITRAFAPRDDQTTAEVDPAPPQDRLHAISRLFAELHEELVARVSSALADLPLAREPVGAGAVTEDVPAEADSGVEARSSGVPLRISKRRSMLEGIEFVLETPQISCRFLNTLSGVICVSSVEEGRLVPLEVLSVQATPEGYQPIRKTVRHRRSGFAYTSVRGLGDAYLAEFCP